MTRSSAFPSDQIIVLICMTLTGVVLMSLGVFPGRTVEVDVLGSPLGIELSGKWLVAGLLVALVSLGMHSLVKAVAGHARMDLRYSATFWVLPALVTLAAAGSVPRQFGHTGNWLGSLVFLGVLLAGVVVAECGTVRMDDPYFRTARLGLNAATYSAALALYVSIASFQVRSLMSATAVILVTFPLALDLLRGTEEQLRTTWLYAAIIALVTGEITWSINGLGLRALYSGALILLVFYTLTGLTQQYLADRLNRAVALEFGTIATLALAMVLLGVRLGHRLPLAETAEDAFQPLGADASQFTGTDALEFELPIPDEPLVLYPPSPLLPVDPWAEAEDQPAGEPAGALPAPTEGR